MAPTDTPHIRAFFIEDADSGQLKGGVNGGLRVHSLIFPLASDINADYL
jgi:hypothetical protein